jgi:hypothetical protein
MLAHTSSSRNNARLKAAVVNCGCFQYLLAPSLFLLSMHLYRQRPRLAILTAVVAAIGCFLMLYRGYFTSLGM